MNKKGFTLIELLAGMVIVIVFSIYFYKIILVVKSKYDSVAETSNVEIEKAFVTRMIYNNLEKYPAACPTKAGDVIYINNGADDIDVVYKTSGVLFTKNVAIFTDSKNTATSDTILFDSMDTSNNKTTKIVIPLVIDDKETNITIFHSCPNI